MQGTGTNWLQDKLGGLPAEAGSAIRQVTEYRGDTTLVVDPTAIRSLVLFLKTNSRLPFPVMMDLFGVDYLKWPEPTPERFAVIYNLYNLEKNERVFLKAWLNEEKPEIDSIHDLYKAANWFEREAWDMFGIVFLNHPHLKRILCHNEFEGHPLRKDYPADGYQRLKSAVVSQEM